MTTSVGNVKRYHQIARLVWKYARSDFLKHTGLDEALDPQDLNAAGSGAATPDALADDLEAMGPTYVKLGQVLSGRPDLLPEPYLKALARLQDDVKPFSYDEVSAIVASELGVKISKAFSRFDEEPIAAASLGQVHSAALRDGRGVVVKVQRPGIRGQIADDFDVLEQIAEFADAHTELGRRYRFHTILKELRDAIQQELDYGREAQNLIKLRNNLKRFELIQVPEPVLDYSTRSVLTMEHIAGRKITAVGPLGRLEMKGGPLAEELFQAYLQQVLVDGLFHADPHPGNVFLTDDGRLALLDLGMVGHTTPSMQDNLLKLLLAISDGQGDDVAELLIRMSEAGEDFNATEFRRRIDKLVASRLDQRLRQVNVGAILLEGSKNAADNGLFVPAELTLLGKTLLQLDEIGRCLDPTFDPNASIRRNVSDLMSQRVRKFATASGAFRSLLEVKDFFVGLPSRLNKIMDAISNHELELKVKAVDVDRVIEGFQAIANRITTGIVLASLIMGASILMQVQTSFRIFGYPGFAMLCFLAAATGGFWLVASVFIQDRRKRKR